MWIDAEPGTFPMMRYLLCFEAGDPAPEDRRVRAYLDQHGLRPKRTWQETPQGIPCQVLQFGQCYLGPHLQTILAMHGRGIVAEAVGRALRDTPSLVGLLDSIPAGELPEIRWTLAGAVLDREAARPAADDPTSIAIDIDVLGDELQALRDARSGPAAPEPARAE